MSEYGEFVKPDVIGSGDVPEDVPAEQQDEIVVVPNAYGPGADSVKFRNGVAVGVWMRELNLEPAEVERRLLEMGLDAKRAAEFRRRRQQGIEADRAIMQDPAVQAFAEVEAKHYRLQSAAKRDFLKGRGA